MKIFKFLLFLVFLVAILKGIDYCIFHDAFSRSLVQYVSSRHVPAQPVDNSEFDLPPPVAVNNSVEAENVRRDEAVARKLAQQNASGGNEYMFHLKSGSSFKGLKENETPEYVTVKQSFGYSGSMVRKIAKQDIDSIEPLSSEPVSITDEEVAIKKALPGFHFYSDGRYSIFTDQDYFKIKKSIAFLKVLSQDFANAFSSLMSGVPRRSYVIIFGNENMYRAFVQKVNPALIQASGFYNPSMNCLVFYDFFQGGEYRRLDEFVKAQSAKIAQLKEENQKYMSVNPQLHHENQVRIQEYEQSLSNYLSREALVAKGRNISVLRHEAVHQLTFDLLDFNPGTAELWLLEGLAEYFAAPSAGTANHEYLALIRQAVQGNARMSLRELFSYRSGESLFTRDKTRIGLFYAESWALFYYLMQPDRREQFLQYLNWIKNIDEKNMNDNQRIAFLEERVGCSIDKLEQVFFAFVKK